MAAANGTLTEAQFYRLWFPEAHPDALEEAMEAVGQFYNPGVRPERTEGEQGPLAYDFLVDGPAIFAAFQRHYGMDLGTAELHWWQFRALLEGLFTHSFRQRVSYRVGDLQGLSAQERAQVLRYRNLYRIGPEQESLQDHLLHLDEILEKNHNERRKE